ncbi:hypothetical protein GCM10010987_03060 [Bradyrhizobium guangdongense]|uniref:Uncharacterized protein n=1 Tax=Bradyrhizobium guangdongense TaxID=1325090 RepID=A0AA87W2D3_9BRAD|nr:hypothetical protein GCM10010987_03060 [Bradyrhizobium guangdongense]
MKYLLVGKGERKIRAVKTAPLQAGAPAFTDMSDRRGHLVCLRAPQDTQAHVTSDAGAAMAISNGIVKTTPCTVETIGKNSNSERRKSGLTRRAKQEQDGMVVKCGCDPCSVERRCHAPA